MQFHNYDLWYKINGGFFSWNKCFSLELNIYNYVFSKNFHNVLGQIPKFEDASFQTFFYLQMKLNMEIMYKLLFGTKISKTENKVQYDFLLLFFNKWSWPECTLSNVTSQCSVKYSNIAHARAHTLITTQQHGCPEPSKGFYC